MTRAAVYTRVSTDGQEDGSSLTTQADRCHQYAQERAYALVGTFSDTHTGAKYRDRPALSELRTLVRAGAVDVVVAFAIDRLSRHQAHLAILAEEFNDHGCRLEFVTEDFEDSAVGRFIRSARAFAAEVEREKITERTMRGKLARLASGRLLIPGVPPYGLQPNADRSGYLPVPAQAPVVQRIFDLYDAGDSIKNICRRLNADGVPTIKGRPWGTSTIFAMLKQPAYCGRPLGFGWSRTVDPIVMPPGLAPELVTPAQWERVQQRLQHSAANPNGPLKRPDATLLRGGLVVCGHCHWRMNVQWWDGTPYYQCGQRFKLKDLHTCAGLPSINAVNLDRAVWLRAEARLRGVADVGGLAPRRDDQTRLAVADALLAQIDRERLRVMRELTQTDDSEVAALWRAELATLGERKRAADVARVDAVASVQREAALAERVRLAAALLGSHPTNEDRRKALFSMGVVVNVYRRGCEPRWELRFNP